MSFGKAVILVLAMGGGWAYAGSVSQTASPSENAAPTTETAPVVSRGQTVLLVALADGIRLSAPGRALKDGKTGDIIPVLNTATRIALKGVVRDGWIELQSPGDPTP